MSVIRELLDELRAFNETPESVGYDLRLDLAELILEELRAKQWTQKQLADATGMKPSFITRLVNSANNCTFEVAGRVCHALGLRPKLVRATEDASAFRMEKWNAQAPIVEEARVHVFISGTQDLRTTEFGILAEARESYSAIGMG